MIQIDSLTCANIPDASNDLFEQLRSRFVINSGQYHYHNLKHILRMVDLCNRFYAPHVDGVHAEAMQIAIWFHDIVYLPKEAGNEEQSAKLAQQFYPHHAMIDAIYRAIVATKSHEAEHDFDQWLIDFDLEILSACPTEYREYATGIRKEYIHVPEEVYRDVRANKVLGHFLAATEGDRPILSNLSSAMGYDRNTLAIRARQNLQWERDLLRSNAPIL